MSLESLEMIREAEERSQAKLLQERRSKQRQKQRW
jgi:hypothetical protein